MIIATVRNEKTRERIMMHIHMDKKSALAFLNDTFKNYNRENWKFEIEESAEIPTRTKIEF